MRHFQVYAWRLFVHQTLPAPPVAGAHDATVVRPPPQGLGRERTPREGQVMGVRRSSIVFATAFSAAALWAAGPGALLAGAQPAGGVCQLQGVANISPPLTGTSQSFAYNFTGMLGTGAMGSCQSNVAGAPTMGTVSAGRQLQQRVTPTTTRPRACTNGVCSDRVTTSTTSSES